MNATRLFFNQGVNWTLGFQLQGPWHLKGRQPKKVLRNPSFNMFTLLGRTHGPRAQFSRLGLGCRCATALSGEAMT